jgi:methionyl-tRNA formyltransferase
LRLFDAEVELMDFAVREFGQILPVPQDPSVGPTYHPKRTPADSQIDPSHSIASQFDKIRVCDPDRFPAFFELRGKKYKLILEKIDD